MDGVEACRADWKELIT